MQTKTNPQREAFIETVVKAAGIRVEQVRTLVRARDGRHYPRVAGWGWVKFIAGEKPADNVLERGTRVYNDRAAAFAGAHRHYNLRSA